MRFLYFTIVSTWCIIIIEDKSSYLMEVITMNRKQALKDLFLAVKKLRDECIMRG